MISNLHKIASSRDKSSDSRVIWAFVHSVVSTSCHHCAFPLMHRVSLDTWYKLIIQVDASQQLHYVCNLL